MLAIYASGIYVGVGLGYWLGGWINDATGGARRFLLSDLAFAWRYWCASPMREPIRGMSELHATATQRYPLREA